MIPKCVRVNPIQASYSGHRKPNHAMKMSRKAPETSSDAATLLAAAGTGEMLSRPSSSGERNLTAPSKTAAAVSKKGESSPNSQSKEDPTSSGATPPLAEANSGDVVGGPPFGDDGNITASSRTPSAESHGRPRFALSEGSGKLKHVEEETTADVVGLPPGKTGPCAARSHRPPNSSTDASLPYPDKLRCNPSHQG